jgi:hypothetical protein
MASCRTRRLGVALTLGTAQQRSLGMTSGLPVWINATDY